MIDLQSKFLKIVVKVKHKLIANFQDRQTYNYHKFVKFLFYILSEMS